MELYRMIETVSLTTVIAKSVAMASEWTINNAASLKINSAILNQRLISAACIIYSSLALKIFFIAGIYSFLLRRQKATFVRVWMNGFLGSECRPPEGGVGAPKKEMPWPPALLSRRSRSGHGASLQAIDTY